MLPVVFFACYNQFAGGDDHIVLAAKRSGADWLHLQAGSNLSDASADTFEEDNPRALPLPMLLLRLFESSEHSRTSPRRIA